MAGGAVQTPMHCMVGGQERAGGFNVVLRHVIAVYSFGSAQRVGGQPAGWAAGAGVQSAAAAARGGQEGRRHVQLQPSSYATLPHTMASGHQPKDSPSRPAWQPPFASWSAGCVAARCPAQLCSRQAAAGTAARTAAALHRGSRLRAVEVTGVRCEDKCARAAAGAQVAGASMHSGGRAGGSGEAAGCGGPRRSLGGISHLMCSHSAGRRAEAHWSMWEPCSAARCGPERERWIACKGLGML